MTAWNAAALTPPHADTDAASEGPAGRACPLRYRYGAQALARSPLVSAETLYVIGGLYGNLPALDAIEALAAREAGPVTLCFNGDFNWFNVDAASFVAINTRVLQHDAIAGNVEAELGADGDEAGCGCAYPESVSGAVVERSNRIHQRLKATAQQHPNITQRLDALAMFARYQVGACRVGVVHGDADALAGWGFDAAALRDPAQQPWLRTAFDRAEVDVFASTHTCAAALHCLDPGPAQRVVINNGAAGMPNAPGDLAGLITRISTQPSPHPVRQGTRVRGVYVDAVPVPYDQGAWLPQFLANWPAGSDAHQSYFDRIVGAMGG